jgi:hypothetical protein
VVPDPRLFRKSRCGRNSSRLAWPSQLEPLEGTTAVLHDAECMLILLDNQKQDEEKVLKTGSIQRGPHGTVRQLHLELRSG